MAIKPKDLGALGKKYPVIIGSAALSLILLVASYLRSGRLHDLSGQAKAKEEALQKILDDIKNGGNLSEQYDALTVATRDLESRLVHSSERARNQQYFYRIESDTGVKEVNLQPITAEPRGPRAPKTLFTGVGYSITVKGDFRQILDFLVRLENGQHFCRLVSGVVGRDTPRGGATATNMITLTLNLELLGLP